MVHIPLQRGCDGRDQLYLCLSCMTGAAPSPDQLQNDLDVCVLLRKHWRHGDCGTSGLRMMRLRNDRAITHRTRYACVGAVLAAAQAVLPAS